MARRSVKRLLHALNTSKNDGNRALACCNLALFHGKNSREAEAIPLYEETLRLGLEGETGAQAMAWLASSLFETGQPPESLVRLAESSRLTTDISLERFLVGLKARILRAGPATRANSPSP